MPARKFVLFSRSGFAADLEAVAAERGVRLVSLEQLVADLGGDDTAS